MSKPIRIILPIMVLVVSIGVVALLIYTRPQAAQLEPPDIKVHVKVMTAELQHRFVTIKAMGKVVAARQLVVQPEVAGRVVYRSDRLIPGSFVSKGEELVRIDQSDYKTALEAQKAFVEQARVALADEKGRKQVAEEEWKGRERQLNKSARQFALREPHLISAKTSLRSSLEQLKKARRDIKRTTVKAPFDAVILDRTVEVGQAVSMQTPLMTLAGSDRFWVEVSLPVSKLTALKVPGVNSQEDQASFAKIRYEAGFNLTIEREGKVKRLNGSVDERGRLARLLVEVEDPFDLERAEGERRLPLLIHSYVQVELMGEVAGTSVEVPRTAVKNGHSLWIVVDHRLVLRKVKVLWRNQESVFVQGISQGEQVVITPLATPTEGMEVVVEPLEKQK